MRPITYKYLSSYKSRTSVLKRGVAPVVGLYSRNSLITGAVATLHRPTFRQVRALTSRARPLRAGSLNSSVTPNVRFAAVAAEVLATAGDCVCA